MWLKRPGGDECVAPAGLDSPRNGLARGADRTKRAHPRPHKQPLAVGEGKADTQLR